VTLSDGVKAKRETNTMPQWAGSCWYYLRYVDARNDDAAFDAFAFDDVDPDAPGSKSGGKLPEGTYKFTITEVELHNEHGNISVECEVADAEDVSTVGRKHFEYVRWPGANDKDGGKTAKEIILAWCYAAKTTSAEVIKARQKAGQGFDTAWLEQMVGRSVIGFVKAGEYEGKPQAKINGNVWALDNPKAKGKPGWIDSAASQTTAPLTNEQPPAAGGDTSFSDLV